MTSVSGDQAGTRPAWIYLALVVGLLSFAASAILIRYASGAPSMAVAAWRTIMAIAILAPAGVPVSMRAWRSLSRRDVWLILLAGVLLGVHFLSWIESIYHTSVGSAAVLVATGPIFMAVFGWLILGERLTKRVSIAIGVAVAGSILLALGDEGAHAPAGGHPMWGNALALFAAMVWAFYLLIGRVVRKRVGWLAYVFPLYVAAGVTVLATALLNGTELTGYPAEIYLLCGAMAIFPQILGHGSFNYAVKWFPAAVLGLLGLLEPIGASILAFVLFAEVPGPTAFVGMALILAAVGSTVAGPAVRKPVEPAG